MIRHRRFGRTNLQVSEVVFGGGFVGGLLVLQDDDTRLKTLRHALNAGINWVDTAPLYGLGGSPGLAAGRVRAPPPRLDQGGAEGRGPR
jgi:D-threo-aldose 1-dehydrogenase